MQHQRNQVGERGQAAGRPRLVVLPMRSTRLGGWMFPAVAIKVVASGIFIQTSA